MALLRARSLFYEIEATFREPPKELKAKYKKCHIERPTGFARLLIKELEFQSSLSRVIQNRYFNIGEESRLDSINQTPFP